MQVIDTDPNVLRQAADVSRHAYEQSMTHVEAEIKGVIPELMETLTPEGPYGYTILPEVRADGSVGLPIITTREGIREAYQLIRGMSELLSVTPLTEIRGFVVHVSGQPLPRAAEGERLRGPAAPDPGHVPFGVGNGDYRRTGVDPGAQEPARRRRRDGGRRGERRHAECGAGARKGLSAPLPVPRCSP